MYYSLRELVGGALIRRASLAPARGVRESNACNACRVGRDPPCARRPRARTYVCSCYVRRKCCEYSSAASPCRAESLASDTNQPLARACETKCESTRSNTTTYRFHMRTQTYSTLHFNDELLQRILQDRTVAVRVCTVLPLGCKCSMTGAPDDTRKENL